MSGVFMALASIGTFFAALLLIKKITVRQFCVICASVSLTWITLLTLYWLGRFPHAAVIGVLMGQSAVGAYYALEKRVKKELLIFRLPFLLTETWLVFAILGLGSFADRSWLLVIVLWALFFFVYAYRSHPRIGALMKRLIECCKNW